MKPYYKTDNCTLYQCDNLDLMKSLPDNYIDLIYCDILYNTGKKFKDYDDNLGTPQEAVLWYEPRLQEMKRILKETGSIYLHMDYRLVHYMKVKMDEIFEINNFQNEIIWSYKSGGSSKKSFAKKHDNILQYSKSKDFVFNNQKEKSYIDKSKGYNPYVEYFEDNKGDYIYINMLNVWNIPIMSTNSNSRTSYSSEKPEEICRRIVEASSNKNDIVADFFMGSGTTGEVALELGRKFIGCDIGDKACKISKERVEKIT